MRAARHSHIFYSPDKDGKMTIYRTAGNPFGHVILRGGHRPNYDTASVDEACEALADVGLPERLVVFRHALRNALIPVVTLVGLQAPLVIGGAVIIEQIFGIPGMGTLLLDAVNQRDYPIITGVFLVVGLAVMLINLLVDLSYGLLDPRVRVRS